MYPSVSVYLSLNHIAGRASKGMSVFSTRRYRSKRWAGEHTRARIELLLQGAQGLSISPSL